MRLRPTLLVASVLAALAAPAAAQAATPCTGASLQPTPENVSQVRAATLCLVNRERSERGLHRLSSVPALQAVATSYAHRMVRERFFDHTAPDGDTFVSRVKRTSYLHDGVKRWSVGENIAWGSGELAAPAEIVKAWMHSPGHRRNILDAGFTELGLGVAVGAPRAGQGTDAGTYVNEFGTRRR